MWVEGLDRRGCWGRSSILKSYVLGLHLNCMALVLDLRPCCDFESPHPGIITTSYAPTQHSPTEDPFVHALALCCGTFLAMVGACKLA